MTAEQKRIAELEARIAVLEAERRPAVATRLPVAAVGSQLITGAEAAPLSFAMPSQSELLRLREIVLDQYPLLKPKLPAGRFADDDEREDVSGFVGAFRWINEIGRGDLDKRRLPRGAVWCLGSRQTAVRGRDCERRCPLRIEQLSI